MKHFKRYGPLVLAVAVITLAMSCERTVTVHEDTSTALNCFGCHSDNNTALVSAEGQYDNSFHGSARIIERNTASCSGCHVSEGFVARVTGGTPLDYENPTAIHCFTCHEPHTRGDLSLRANDPYELANGESFDLGAANICTWCHQARRNVNTYVSGQVSLSSHWGPHHSPQGDMLIGTNGYEYAGFTYNQTNHRGATANGCKDCHFDKTRNYVIGGHAFNMRFDLEGEELILTEACEGCHGSIDDFNDVNNVQDDTHALMDSLHTLLEAAGLVDADGHPLSVTTSADSAGAVWNFLMAEEDRSVGVHNKRYIHSLLISGIQFMEGTLQPTSGYLAADRKSKEETTFYSPE